jgi:antitoxin component of MazEF toxin-antitoxin module
MPKLAKNMYKSLVTGERRLNCYVISIPKKVVEQTNIKDDDNLKVYSEGNKIIIEKE